MRSPVPPGSSSLPAAARASLEPRANVSAPQRAAVGSENQAHARRGALAFLLVLQAFLSRLFLSFANTNARLTPACGPHHRARALPAARATGLSRGATGVYAAGRQAFIRRYLRQRLSPQQRLSPHQRLLPHKRLSRLTNQRQSHLATLASKAAALRPKSCARRVRGGGRCCGAGGFCPSGGPNFLARWRV